MTNTLESPSQIDQIIEKRFSPRKFTGTPISEEILGHIFNQAKWAASCFNEQPWRFYYAHQGSEGFDKIHQCLSEGNKPWTQNASVLIIASAKTRFARNNKENRHAWYDLGQSVATLALSAWEKGIGIHQMAGFDAAKAKELLKLEEDEDAVTAIAIGPFDETKEDRSRNSVSDFTKNIE